MKTLALPLSVLLCAATLPVEAQELVLDPWVLEVGAEAPPAELLDPPDAKLVPLDAGARAPYEGVLLDTATSARWVARLVWYKKQLKIDANSLRGAMQKQAIYYQKLDAAHAASCGREILGLRTDLREQAASFERAKKVPFYKTWTFGMITGLVAGVGAASLVTWSATK